MFENFIIVSLYIATIIALTAFFYGIFLPEKKQEHKN